MEASLLVLPGRATSRFVKVHRARNEQCQSGCTNFPRGKSDLCSSISSRSRTGNCAGTSARSGYGVLVHIDEPNRPNRCSFSSTAAPSFIRPLPHAHRTRALSCRAVPANWQHPCRIPTGALPNGSPLSRVSSTLKHPPPRQGSKLLTRTRECRASQSAAAFPTWSGDRDGDVEKQGEKYKERNGANLGPSILPSSSFSATAPDGPLPSTPAPAPPRPEHSPIPTPEMSGAALAAAHAVAPKPLPPPPKDQSILGVLPYLWKLAAEDRTLRWRLGVALVLLVAGKAAGLAGPLMFKRALDALTKTEGPMSRTAAVAAVSALILSAASKAVSAVSTELRNVVFTPVGQSTARRVEYHFFAHILAMDTAFHLDRKTGSLARIIERGKRSIVMIFRAVVFTFIPTAVELALVCGLLGKHISLSFAAVVLLTFTAYTAWTVALTKASVSIRKEVNRLDGLATGKVVDVLLNYETVVQFNNQKLDLTHYDSLLQSYQQEWVKLERVSAALNGGQTTIIAIGLATVMAMAGMRVAQKTMTVGDLVLVNGLILQLSLPLQFLGFLYRDVRQSLVDMEAMFHMLSVQSSIQDGPLELPDRKGGVALEVEGLKFGYSDAQQVLKGVSFFARPGESVALVGPSGSGKSTVVKLLLRLFDPQEGSIRIDGIDARELKQASLRQAVAVVPQDTVLFNDTIRYNIAYGRPGARPEELDWAVQQAKLDETLRRMPEGYDTLVGERGLKLSGGEKQRVAIARAFLKNPRLLICDEATSALDSATEVSILTSLKELAEGRTCVFVAHRLSTIKHCDHILVMEQGLVVERGNHEELLARKGMYASMWALQDSERNVLGEEPPSEELEAEGGWASGFPGNSNGSPATAAAGAAAAHSAPLAVAGVLPAEAAGGAVNGVGLQGSGTRAGGVEVRWGRADREGVGPQSGVAQSIGEGEMKLHQRLDSSSTLTREFLGDSDYVRGSEVVERDVEPVEHLREHGNDPLTKGGSDSDGER